jgi:hypothetical protein
MKATLRKNGDYMVTVKVRHNLSLADILLAAAHKEWYSRGSTESLAEILKRAKDEFQDHGDSWREHVEDDLPEIAVIALKYLKHFEIRLTQTFGFASFTNAQREIKEYME